MLWSNCLLLVNLIPFVIGTWTLRIRSQDDEGRPRIEEKRSTDRQVVSRDFQIPGPNFKRGTTYGIGRYGEGPGIYAPIEYLPSQQEQKKTEIYANNYSDEEEGDEGVTQELYEATTKRSSSIPAALRRNFGGRDSTGQNTKSTSSESSEQHEEYIYPNKKSKLKPNRRRKIKRPSAKLRATTVKIAEEDFGIPENAALTGGGGGSKEKPKSEDKNLALEIGSENGKYALIDKFFENKRINSPPGVVSYAQSDDFKNDNDKTLGNLKKSDIWLSEGHLLVLKGGNLDSNAKETWKPIDAYVRDKVPLRIPLDTNNPPPFPVFVNKTGPPVFLREPPPFALYPPPGFGNQTFDPSLLPPPGLVPLFPNGTVPDYFGPPPPGYAPGYGGGNNTFPPPYPFPPPGSFNGSFPPPPGPPPHFFPFPPPGANFINGSFPPLPPGFHPGNFSGHGGSPNFPLLPPLVLNPNDNETDDPSIFLPPPYDFDYYEDNTTLVPPGPFAPGLVVPPPRNFYSVYNRTGNPNQETFQPTPNPNDITFSKANTRKRPQRPNAKKPNFPIIVHRPVLISNEEGEVSEEDTTTPYGGGGVNGGRKRVRPGKKRKRPRPGKVNKGIFEVVNNDGSFEEVPDTDAPSIVLPGLKDNSNHPEINNNGGGGVHRPVTTDDTPRIPIVSTESPQNYVYVQGQLKTLAELAGEGGGQDGGFEYKITPRPLFDKHGYPTRVLAEDEQEITIIEYPNTSTKRPAVAINNLRPRPPLPNVVNVNEAPPPLQQQHHLQYNPIYNFYQVTPVSTAKHRPSPPISTSSTPTSFSFTHNGDHQTIIQHEEGNDGNQPPHTDVQSPQIIAVRPPIYNVNNNNNNNEEVEEEVVEEEEEDDDDSVTNNINNNNLHHQTVHNNNNNNNNNEGQIIFHPDDYQQLRPVGPTYFTATKTNQPGNLHVVQNHNNNNNNNNQRPPPQIVTHNQFPIQQYPSINPNIGNVQRPLPFNNNNNNNANRNHPPTNFGFRPAFGVPRQEKQQPSRVIFPGQSTGSSFKPARTPLFLHPQGYYSPLSQFFQPLNHLAGNLGNFGPIPNQFFQQLPLNRQQFRPSYNQNPQPIFEQQRQQLRQQQKQEPVLYKTESGSSQQLRAHSPQNSQLAGFLQNQIVPLNQDILVNYREPLPQYNTESESITVRSAPLRAGPSPTPLQRQTARKAPSASPSSVDASAVLNPHPGSFYSFQRGGPGGFSYKIRL